MNEAIVQATETMCNTALIIQVMRILPITIIIFFVSLFIYKIVKGDI